jgi:hypothetical protein
MRFSMFPSDDLNPETLKDALKGAAYKEPPKSIAGAMEFAIENYKLGNTARAAQHLKAAGMQGSPKELIALVEAEIHKRATKSIQEAEKPTVRTHAIKDQETEIIEDAFNEAMVFDDLTLLAIKHRKFVSAFVDSKDPETAHFRARDIVLCLLSLVRDGYNPSTLVKAVFKDIEEARCRATGSYRNVHDHKHAEEASSKKTLLDDLADHIA